MKKWLIVHDLQSFSENSDTIGFAVKRSLDGVPARDSRGAPVPADAKLLEMRPGDVVVYYCRGDSVIKGLFEIVRTCYEKDPRWQESPYQFEIKPVMVPDEPYDFKPLVGSLDLFKDLPDRRRWGLKLRGIYNAVQRLTERDYSTIKGALFAAGEPIGEEKDSETELAGYRQHQRIQHKIAELGAKNGRRVHVARNDKGKIREVITEVLEDVPKFHTDEVLDIARRVDVLFFDERRDVLTHAFEIEHTPVIYSGLLRLNDIAESYPIGGVQFIIVSDESNNERFESELLRPSFSRLRENDCRFVSYKEVENEWRQLQDRKPPPF